MTKASRLLLVYPFESSTKEPSHLMNNITCHPFSQTHKAKHHNHKDCRQSKQE
jgi:hypothetical protein